VIKWKDPLKLGGRTLLYVLMGQDDFSISQAVEEIKKGMGDPSLLSANTTILDGQQVSLDQLKAACETVPFLAEKRLVIIKGLLERFEPKDKTSRKAKIRPRQNEHKSLAAYISSIPDSTILVLIDGKIRSGNPLLKELSGRAEIKSFPLLRDDKLRQWIQRRVEGEGGSISPQAVSLLAHIVGGNLWTMANEINKLVLFVSGRRIEQEDVRMMTGYAQEANVFAMIDAILEFKAGEAEQLLQQLLQRGAAPAYLLVMLSRQVQLMVRAKELRRQGKAETVVQNRLGLTSEFALRKTLEQADRYPLERLREIYQKLLQTDLSIKTGKYGGELALNILIAELCQKRRAGEIGG